jgi:copper(I)-binding protein
VAKSAGWLTPTSLVILLLSLLAGASSGMGLSPRSPQIVIEGQEARLSPVMRGVGSVFMKIRNSGNGDDSLLYVTMNVSGTIAELHDMKDGRMVKREKIPLPSGSVVELRPGGLHIMVYKLPKDIREDQEFTLRLVFEKSGERLVPVKFRASGRNRSRYSQ